MPPPARAGGPGSRRARPPAGGAITPEFLTACVRRQLDADSIVLNEGITNYGVVHDHLAMTRPGSIFASGGGSLGWNGGAAIGAKLAAPERTVVAMTGDGSYLFSVPSSVHWMAARYRTPFLQVVFNNGGWRAPRFSTLAVHPDGYASRAAISTSPSRRRRLCRHRRRRGRGARRPRRAARGPRGRRSPRRSASCARRAAPPSSTWAGRCTASLKERGRPQLIPTAEGEAMGR